MLVWILLAGFLATAEVKTAEVIQLEVSEAEWFESFQKLRMKRWRAELSNSERRQWDSLMRGRIQTLRQKLEIKLKDVQALQLQEASTQAHARDLGSACQKLLGTLMFVTSRREDRLGLKASPKSQDMPFLELVLEQCLTRRQRVQQSAAELHAGVLALWEEIHQLESAVERLKELHQKAPQQDDLKAVASFSERALVERHAWYFPCLHSRVGEPFGMKKRTHVSKGVLLESPEEEVRAIGVGRVLFQGVLPGLGLALLIDHGNLIPSENGKGPEKFYSLLGHLESTKVDRGEEVGAAQVVGTMRQHVYFEVRRGSVPFDPLGGDLQWVGN